MYHDWYWYLVIPFFIIYAIVVFKYQKKENIRQAKQWKQVREEVALVEAVAAETRRKIRETESKMLAIEIVNEMERRYLIARPDGRVVQ